MFAKCVSLLAQNKEHMCKMHFSIRHPFPQADTDVIHVIKMLPDLFPPFLHATNWSIYIARPGNKASWMSIVLMVKTRYVPVLKYIFTLSHFQRLTSLLIRTHSD